MATLYSLRPCLRLKQSIPNGANIHTGESCAVKGVLATDAHGWTRIKTIKPKNPCSSVSIRGYPLFVVPLPPAEEKHTQRGKHAYGQILRGEGRFGHGYTRMDSDKNKQTQHPCSSVSIRGYPLFVVPLERQKTFFTLG